MYRVKSFPRWLGHAIDNNQYWKKYHNLMTLLLLSQEEVGNILNIMWLNSRLNSSLFRETSPPIDLFPWKQTGDSSVDPVLYVLSYSFRLFWSMYRSILILSFSIVFSKPLADISLPDQCILTSHSLGKPLSPIHLQLNSVWSASLLLSLNFVFTDYTCISHSWLYVHTRIPTRAIILIKLFSQLYTQ